MSRKLSKPNRSQRLTLQKCCSCSRASTILPGTHHSFLHPGSCLFSPLPFGGEQSVCHDMHGKAKRFADAYGASGPC